MTFIPIFEPRLDVSGHQLVTEISSVVQQTFPYNVNTRLINTDVTGSGTITQASAMAVLQTTAASSSSARIASKEFVRYRTGQGSAASIDALFTAGVANSTQLVGLGDDDDGLFFGFVGASFSIVTRKNTGDTVIAQAFWNEDVMDGSGGSTMTLDPTKLNTFVIQFQLNGDLDFSIQDDTESQIVLVHRIPYTGSNTEPSVFNPSFPVVAESENTTNTSNIIVRVAAMAGVIQGKIIEVGPINGARAMAVTVGTTLVPIFSVRNKATFQGVTNRIQLRQLFLSIANDGNKDVEIVLIENGSLTGDSFSDVSTNTSPVEVDEDATAITGGTETLQLTIGKNSSDPIPIGLLDSLQNPGELLTIAGVVNTATTVVTGAISWRELF